MTTRDLALAGLEQALNGLIALDPQAGRRLAGFHGRVVAIQLRGLELTLYLVPDQQGRLQLLGSIEGEPDCTLSGSPLDLLRSGDRDQAPAQLFAGRLSIDGDTELGHRFGEVLGELDIDWEEQLSRLTGDVLAHELGTAARRGAAWGRRTGAVLGRDLAEYLTEEARLLPAPAAAADFLDDVDRLRDDLERLEARVKRLQDRLREQP